MTRPFLGIDTATDRATVAVGAGEHPWAHRTLVGARRQAAELLPVVDELLRAAGARIGDLAGIVVGDGPASFTGLRVGWALAKGLAQHRGTPVLAVPSLLGHARSASVALALDGRVVVAACFDALRGEVFGAVYACGGNGGVETIVEPALLTVAELAARAPAPPVRAVGDGAERHAAAVREWTGADPFVLTDESAPPVAWSLVTLRAVGRPVHDSSEPVYGRPAEAQARWEARHGRPLPHSPR